MTARISLSFGKTGGHRFRLRAIALALCRPPLQKIEKREHKHPHNINKVPVQTGDPQCESRDL